MATLDTFGVWRIGELSRRVGVSEHLLRAWERRYGLLDPQRSPGGFRLYSPTDETRVRRMQAQLARGLSAAEAARATLAEPPAARPDVPEQADEDQLARPEGLAATAAALTQALDAVDEPAAQACWTGCSPRSRWRPCSARWCCPTCTSSVSAGSAGRSASPRNTLPAPCSAGGWLP